MAKAERQRITILGAGCVGASLGMALRNSPNADRFEVVGHDREPSRARRAQARGAFDRVALTLGGALERARFVILAVPLESLRETLADVGAILAGEEGVVLTDTAPLKAPVLQWAEALLPRGCHFVGGDPFPAPQEGRWQLAHGLEAARDDLFRDAIYALVPAPQAHPGAVRAVAEMAQLIGAQPLLMEAQEHDLARLLTDTLPAFSAAALIAATATRPDWEEARKAAGYGYATATAAVALHDAPSLRMMAMLEREALLPRLDRLLQELGELRERLAAGDAEALEQRFAEAGRLRAEWMARARARHWEIELPAASIPNLFRRSMQAVVGRFGADDEEPPTA